MRRSAAERARADILFSGGGTAGHILPALAVASALVERGHDKSDIAFIGSRRGMEASFIPQAGYAITLLPGRGIRRKLTFANFGAVLGLMSAFALSLRFVATRRPRVIVSIGGYASVPASLAGALFRVPIIVVNVDIVPGAANRLIARFATRCAVSSSSVALPHKQVTGVPVRQAVLDVDTTEQGRSASRARFEVGDGRVVVAVIGGSLGAGRLNDAAGALAETLRERSDLMIIHVAGARDVERSLKRRDAISFGEAPHLEYRVLAYEENLPELLNAADVVISRAGASTLAEIAVLGVPSILVPLPNSPGDHQRLNANELVAAGAAVLVEDADATAEVLGPILEALMIDEECRSVMALAARSQGTPDAAKRIAELIDTTEPLGRTFEGKQS